MATKKTVTPKKRMPPKIVICDEQGHMIAKGVSEQMALEAAAKLVQPHHSNGHGSGYPFVGIYQLVSVVRRKTAPVEIEEISCCREK
jgi:hypothetical protein